MFPKILIAISSEFLSEDAVKRGAQLADKFNSEVTLVYIIEEKTLETVDKVSEGLRTYQDREETKNEIIKKQGLCTGDLVLKKFDDILKKRGILAQKKIVHGKFSEIIKREITEKKFDLVIIGFKRGCLLNYRLFNEVKVPIWVEGEGKKNRILAICSNLAPNELVPQISINLAKHLKSNLQMAYIIDTGDKIQVDENMRRSNKKSLEDLMEVGKKFVKNMEKKGIKIELLTGALEKECMTAAERAKADIIIIGREQKKGLLGGFLPRNTQLKIAERAHHSMLFVK